LPDLKERQFIETRLNMVKIFIGSVPVKLHNIVHNLNL